MLVFLIPVGDGKWDGDRWMCGMQQLLPVYQPSIFGVVQSNEYTLLIHITKRKWGNGMG